MKLRSHAGALSTEKAEEILGGKKVPDNEAIDKKENLLHKNYKLREQNRSDDKKKLQNQNFNQNNKSANKVPNSAVGLDAGKENKIKKRPKRVMFQKCSEMISCSSGSQIPLQEKNNSSLENRKKVTVIANINSNFKGKTYVSHRKNINYEKIMNDVPLCKTSNECEVLISDQENRFKNQLDGENQCIAKHKEKFPIWRKKPNIFEAKCGVKRKSFVDVYDISQDEDMSNDTKYKKKKINRRKIVKKTVDKNRCLTISNKNTNVNKKYSNTSKPVQNKLNKLTANQLLNNIPSNPPTVKINTPALSSDKKLEVISADVVEENSQNDVANKSLQVILPTDNVEENNQDSVIDDDGLDVTSEHLEIDKTCIGTKSQKDAKDFLLNLADELEKSLTIPRMTSTPDSTLLNGPVIQHLPSNILLQLNISSVHPKSKKGLKIPVKIGNSLSFKGAEITLFESPIKNSKKKDPANIRSPKKNVQINLFDNFTEQSKIDDLECSVVEPKKAYHSPDNFKAHLARTKRISEAIKRDAKKTKEEIMIEKMTQHFEEVSSTELCIE